MDVTNPYQTPAGQLAADDSTFGEIKFFSPDTRIGRLRYLAHGFLAMLACYLILGVGAGLAVALSGVFWLVFAAGYIAMMAVTVVLLIQRLHDLNRTGWLSLLILVPLLNLFFVLYVIFTPGTKGSNNYGLQPPPNKTWHWILGMMTPVFFVVGILAAIALPAYQDYIDRANGMSENATEYSDYDEYEHENEH